MTHSVIICLTHFLRVAARLGATPVSNGHQRIYQRRSQAFSGR
jgi:hypothetical protein